MEEISVLSMIFTAIMALSCLFLILAPFFNWNLHLTPVSSEEIPANEKEVLLTTLNELEFEYKMDKLSKKDYADLKKQYESKVSKIMKTAATETGIKQQEQNQEILDQVEKEIQEAMQQHKKKKGES